MNKKGFTLVEVLAVIAILSLVIIIVATSGFGAFNNTKNNIIEENYKIIKDAANLVMTEVLHCDDNLDNELYESFNKNNCQELIETASSNSCLQIKLQYLVDNKYLTNSGAKDILKSDSNYYVKGCLNETTGTSGNVEDKIVIKKPLKGEAH